VGSRREALVAWYRHNRRDLPWRRTRNAYAVWVSEVMLQQTRVETVVPYYVRFLAAMPTVHALAEAPLDRVLELWSGLGYYRRARLLHRGARDVVLHHRGELPRMPSELASIAGIGRYTAGAIASIAHGIEAPIVDGNVARVLSRLEALRDDPASTRGKKKLWAIAESLARGPSPGDLNQALMELGACGVCPIEAGCRGRALGIERTLPRMAPKRAVPTLEMRAFVIQTERGIVCGKRALDALYGGLWEPPILDDKRRSLFGLRMSSFATRGRLVHVLTHRRLTVDVVYTRTRRALELEPLGDYERFELVQADALASRAMSRLARRALAIATTS
jgi:A/G-specific adenine glycosylase